MNSAERVERLMAEAFAAARRAGPKLRAARHRLLDADQQLYDLEGMLRGRAPVRVLFAGRASVLDSVRKFLFSGPVDIRPLGPAAPLGLHHRMARLLTPSVDLLMWEAWPWDTSVDGPDGSYVVQVWLDAHVDPGQDWDRFQHTQLSENIQRTLKKAHQRNVEFDVVEDRVNYERFYHEMMVPMALGRFGENVHVPGLDAFLSHWDGAQHRLLLLKEEGQPVAGAALVYQPKMRELTLSLYGEGPAVRQDASRHRDATALLNEWVFQDAIRRHLSVNLASTRPFLDDGVLNYKRQWGCHFGPSAIFPRYRLQFVSKAADDLLAAAPFFHVAPDGMRGEAAYAPPAGQDPAHELEVRLKAAVFAGLRRITVHVRGDARLAGALAQELPSVKGCPLVYVPSAGTGHTASEAA